MVVGSVLGGGSVASDVAVVVGSVLNCGPFEKKVQDAQGVVNVLNNRLRTLGVKAGMAHSSFQREKLLKQIKEIEDNELAPAVDALNAAKT